MRTASCFISDYSVGDEKKNLLPKQGEGITLKLTKAKGTIWWRISIAISEHIFCVHKLSTLTNALFIPTWVFSL